MSPWEKVTTWNLVGSACDAKLKDLLNIEWLRIHILDENAIKVREKESEAVSWFSYY